MKQYFKFSGRAPRAEFWGVIIAGWSLLFISQALVGILIGLQKQAIIPDAAVYSSYLILLAASIAYVWLFVASLVRRCRDVGINVLWSISAFIVPLAWLVIACLPSAPVSPEESPKE